MRALSDIADQAITRAVQGGADEVQVQLQNGSGISVSARHGQLETIEKHNDAQLTVNVYREHQLGSASSADFSEEGIESTVDAALSIARFTAADECIGLADAELMATDLIDLDLYHPCELQEDQLLDLAIACEDAALKTDKRLSNSEGSQLSSYSGSSLYANSHGFEAERRASRHSFSCAVIAAEADQMQRDYWYDTARNFQQLSQAESIGKQAAERTIRRLGARRLASTQAAVMFEAPIAKSLFSHLFAALGGMAVYKKASFLAAKVGSAILPATVSITERPQIPGAYASAMYDLEGVATPIERKIVDGGVLQTYLLGSYSARKLKLVTTANAGGVRNVLVSNDAVDHQQLIKQMHRGLLVTELIGSGVNIVTGDYSRGVSGFWVEGGEIQYPVEEITIAGNLADMCRNLVAIGDDVDKRGNVQCGSILLENMTIAGS